MRNPIPQVVMYLSENRTLLLGRVGRILNQSSAASTLLVSLDGELDLIDPVNDRCYRSKSFLVPVGVRATIDTHDSLVALVFLDALGKDFAALVSRMKETIEIDENARILRGFHGEAGAIRRGAYLLENRPSAEDTFKRLEEWIGEPAPETYLAPDERVAKAVEMIKSSCHRNVSVGDIARDLNMSVPRLVQLFKKTTGVPIRRFRLWHRIYMTAALKNSGLPMTQAALTAGFADYAHFSRTFKEMGGISPSEVLSTKKNASIFVLPPTMEMPSTEGVGNV